MSAKHLRPGIFHLGKAPFNTVDELCISGCGPRRKQIDRSAFGMGDETDLYSQDDEILASTKRDFCE